MKPSDVIDLVRVTDPAADLPPADMAARDALLVDIVATPARRRRQWRRPRLAAPALAAIAAASAAFALLGGGLLSGSSGSAEAEAMTALLRSATVSGAGNLVPQRPPRAGQYLYTRAVSEGFATTDDPHGDALVASVPETRELWLNGDGAGWETRSSGAPRFATPRDRSRWIEAGRPKLGSNEDHATRYDSLPVDASSLPGNPDAFYRAITDDGRADQSSLHDRLHEALTPTYLTPAQRLALYDAVQRLPGAKVVDRVKDPAGRIGTGVALDFTASNYRERVMFIFDPRSDALLAEISSALDGNAMGYPAGTPTGMTTYTRVAVVDHVRERP